MTETPIPNDEELKALIKKLELTRDVNVLAQRIAALMVNAADFTDSHTTFAYNILAIASSPNKRIELTADSRRNLKTVLLLLTK